MKRIFVENGKVRELSEEEFEKLPPSTSVSDIVKEMTPEEIEAFHWERYERFIKPLMEHNERELKRLK